jgi:hypothetical protein
MEGQTMKVIWHKTIIEKLMGICHEASRTGKKVDYVLLTSQEYDELRYSAHGYHFDFPSYRVGRHVGNHTAFDVVEIPVDPSRHYQESYRGLRYVRFPVLPETFMGLRLVVAPQEFH